MRTIKPTVSKTLKTRTTTRKSVKKALETPDVKMPSLSVNLSLDKEKIQEAIRLKAYELFVQRGYQHGFAEQDWVAAEQIILNETR